MPQLEQTVATQEKISQVPPLQVAEPNAVRQELGLNTLDDPAGLKTKLLKDPSAVQAAKSFVAELLNVNTDDEGNKQQRVDAVEKIGGQYQQKAVRMNALLEQPLKRLQEAGGEGGQIAKALVDLKVQFDSVDPARFDFSPGFAGRMFGWLPFVGQPLNRYFTKFQAAGNVITALFDSLDVSKQTIIRDIQVLGDEKALMRELTVNLEKTIGAALLIDDELQAALDQIPEEDPKHAFIKTELLFSLRQRITDLQHCLLVNQQGVIAFEVLIRNNEELIRGVTRCREVALPALRIGVTTAVALANQKIVIEKIEAIDKMAGDMLEYNATLLRTQGVDIHKRAATGQLDDGKLANAIKNTIGALDDLTAFRNKAVESMKTAIGDRKIQLELAEKAIQKMERGNQAKPALELKLDTMSAEQSKS